jgi:hypothetical protein
VIIDMGGGESYNTHADEIRASGDVETALMGPILVSAEVHQGDPGEDGQPRFVAHVEVGGWEVLICQSQLDPGAVNIEIINENMDEHPELPRLSVHLNDGVLFDDREIERTVIAAPGVDGRTVISCPHSSRTREGRCRGCGQTPWGDEERPCTVCGRDDVVTPRGAEPRCNRHTSAAGS